MKYLIILLCTFAAACGNAVKPVDQTADNSGPATRSERPQTAIAHGPDKKDPPAGGQSKWTQSGDPIDTAKLEAAVDAAEKAVQARSNDASAKKALAAAYFDRAVALTEARQYASALGDYRRTLKYDPENAEAKTWIDQIVSIYSSINRESPKEGEEPPPLPFTKGK